MSEIDGKIEANIGEGVTLPCDGMFGSGGMVESFESDKTVTQARVTRRSRPEVRRMDSEDSGPQMAPQSERAVVWQLLGDFWRAVLVLVGRFFAGR